MHVFNMSKNRRPFSSLTKTLVILIQFFLGRRGLPVLNEIDRYSILHTVDTVEQRVLLNSVSVGLVSERSTNKNLENLEQGT